MTTNAEISEILAMLGAAYPRFKLTKEAVTVYARLLQDIPADELRAAALKCATGNDFFPSVHELRQAIAELKREAQKIPSAYEAWSFVKDKPHYEIMKRVEEHDGKFYMVEFPVTWEHPFVEHVARLLGWPDSFPGDNPVADRAHFFKAYEHELGREIESSVQLPELTQFVERSRSALPQKIQNVLPEGL